MLYIFALFQELLSRFVKRRKYDPISWRQVLKGTLIQISRWRGVGGTIIAGLKCYWKIHLFCLPLLPRYTLERTMSLNAERLQDAPTHLVFLYFNKSWKHIGLSRFLSLHFHKEYDLFIHLSNICWVSFRCQTLSWAWENLWWHSEIGPLLSQDLHV